MQPEGIEAAVRNAASSAHFAEGTFLNFSVTPFVPSALQGCSKERYDSLGLEGLTLRSRKGSGTFYRQATDTAFVHTQVRQTAVQGLSAQEEAAACLSVRGCYRCQGGAGWLVQVGTALQDQGIC